MLNQIKRAVISLISKDTDQYHTGQVDYNNKTKEVEFVYPYGIAGNAPDGSVVLLFNVNGQEENQAGIPYYPQMRFKNLAKGEFVVGNFLTGSYTKFKADGSIEVFSKTGEQMTITEDLTITVGGNLAVVVAGGVAITAGGSVDIHGENQTVNMYGSYNIGGPSGAAIARVGDTVTCPAGTGHITTGSTHHKAT